MKKKKILIVSRSFYPMNSPRSLRTTELVKEFARLGHDVTILTVKNKRYHNSFEDEFGVNIKDMGTPRFRAVDISKGSRITVLARRALRRGLNLLFEYPNIEFFWKAKKSLEKECGYDLLISIAVPHPIHWGVASAMKKDRPITKTWVADCGDPFYGRQNDSFKVPFYFGLIEKWAFRKSDFISIPFEGAKSAYFSEIQHKIRVIPQGFRFPIIKPYDDKKKNSITHFAYSGNITSYLHYAIPFFELLNTVKIPFKFIIFTKKKGLFVKYLNHEVLEKCELRDYVPRNDLLKELNKVDFLIHFPYQNKTQRSLKLVDYYYLKKPILSFVNDENSRQAFIEFLHGDFSRQIKAEDPEQFYIENVCNQFLKLCGHEAL